MTASPPAAWPKIYAAVSLTTAATLLLELALTRVFSVILFYHFAFMAISIALFGLGAGALGSYYLAGRRGAPPWSRLGSVCLLNLFATSAMLVVVLGQRVSTELTWRNSLKLALVYVEVSVPFLLAGMVISVAVSETVERIDRVYFFDLLGAGAGCLILIPLLDWTGGPNAILGAAVLYGAAGALWYSASGSRRKSALAAAAALITALFLVLNARAGWLDVRFAKGLDIPKELFVKWNSFSRVAVKPDDGAGNPHIVIDADAATSIPRFSPSELTPRQAAEALASGAGLPYWIRPGAKTLVIGPGGGFDVARALAGGSRDVVGVEINPIIIHDIMKDRFAQASRRLYFRPEVRIYVEDGRSFLARHPEKYQVIQMTLVDTWASTASGAFALTENNLYTVEAFLDYFARLTDDGLLAITRWGFEPPRESLRVVSLGLEALRRLGAPEPRSHFLVWRDFPAQAAGYGALDTIVVKRTPFRDEEIHRARELANRARASVLYSPAEAIPNPFTELLSAGDPRRFWERYRFDVSPATDNRPFFFYTVRPSQIWSLLSFQRTEDLKINIGVMMLFALLGVSIAATAGMLLLPPLLPGVRLPRSRPLLLHLAYFFAIGAGFIMAEVAFIQKFVLFLGRPTYSLTVVVFSLLIAGGLGSYCSHRVVRGEDRRLSWILAAAAAAIASVGAFGPPLLRAAVGLPLAAKCGISALLLFPAGFLMGIPFPSGLRRLEQRFPPAVRWAWAVNAASSVLGSVGAIFLALHLGLMQTLLLGASAYVAALAVVLHTGQRPHQRARNAG